MSKIELKQALLLARHQLASEGGKARAKQLSPQRRKAIATAAGRKGGRPRKK